MIEKFFRDDLKKFKNYNVLCQNAKIKLDANESFINIMDECKEEIVKTVENINLNRYPESDSLELCSVYSDYLGVPNKNVIAGNGSDQMIQVIINTFIEKGDKVVTLNPEFSMYQYYTEVSGGKNIKVQTDENFKCDISYLIDKVNSENAKIFVFSNPCNPTGAIMDEEDIVKIIRGCNSIVVLDEAYTEFYGKSFIKRFNEFKNLIVLRTCSKIGLAALRIGFLIANDDLMNEIKKVKPPFNVNTVTQKIVSAVFKRKDIVRKNIDEIVAGRNYLYSELSKIKGIKVYPSKANFVLISLPDCEKVNKKLLERGIQVRSFKDERLKNCLRITAGKREENDMLLNAMREILKE